MKKDADALQAEFQQANEEYRENGYLNYVKVAGSVPVGQYQRLAKVITAQILSNPKSIKVLQGIAAEQFDVFDIISSVNDYVTKKGYLEGRNFNAEKLEADIRRGKLRDNVFKNVVAKQKPAKLKKVVQRPEAAEHAAQPHM